MLKQLPFHWQGGVDFIVLSVVIYWLLNWAKQTRILRLLIGIGALLVGGTLARWLELVVTAWILHLAAIVAVLLLVLVHYAEIRRALTHLDPLSRWIRGATVGQPTDLAAVAEAAFALAATRYGALIVLSRQDRLHSLVTGGVPLEGMVSREILEAIFRKFSPVHDGAVIMEGPLIARVGAFLPLTQREDLPKFFGTRHRAAFGLAEQSDALVIVVSEERGEVSLIEGSTVCRVDNPDELARQIQSLQSAKPAWSSRNALAGVFGNRRLKMYALGIASLIWMLVFMTGTSVRTFAVPVEFRNVPPGMEISESSTSMIEIQLRAVPSLFSTLDESQLVEVVDLKRMSEGVHSVTVQAVDLNLPPGISLEQASPLALRVQLVSPNSRGS
jgi:diadenylate cyclase